MRDCDLTIFRLYYAHQGPVQPPSFGARQQLLDLKSSSANIASVCRHAISLNLCLLERLFYRCSVKSNLRPEPLPPLMATVFLPFTWHSVVTTGTRRNPLKSLSVFGVFFFFLTVGGVKARLINAQILIRYDYNGCILI